ncbi:MAG: hypothetical protein WC966_08590 [Bradymonadales bacterium]
MSSGEQFNQIAEVVLSVSRKVVIAQRSNGDYWFNEWTAGPSFTGFTSKGFGVSKNLLAEFIQALHAVTANERSEEQRLQTSNDKELVVWRPAPNQVDIRQWVTSDKYTGYTKKGIRLINSNALKLLETAKALQEFSAEEPQAAPASMAAESQPVIESQTFTGHGCLSCGTTTRHVFSHGMCEVCYNRENRVYTTQTPQYAEPVEPQNDETEKFKEANQEALLKAISIHGRKCYVCQLPYNSLHKNLTIYYADGNDANVSDNNVYPICRNCAASMPSY